MANAQSSPLLRLPNLAREHVVLLMDIRQQYLFATLSKKSKTVARNGVRLSSYVYDLILYAGVTTMSVKKDCSQELKLEIVPNKIHYPEDASDVIVLKVDDIREQSINSLVFLVDLFQISSFKIDTHQTSNVLVKELSKVVRNLKMVIDELEVQTEIGGNQNELFGWVMDNCREVKQLKNYCSITPDFEWNSEQPFTLKCCYLRNSPFLTLDHLTRLFSNCRLFRTWDNNHKMSTQDLNQLIKLWMKGDSKLEYIQIPVKRFFSFQEALTDIEKTRVDRAYLQNNLHSFRHGVAYKIRRESGEEAVVCLEPRYTGVMTFFITTHFNENNCDLWSPSNSI